MELRGIVLLAGEVIPHYWPARTFVHHNPLHGLEHLRERVARPRLVRMGRNRARRKARVDVVHVH